VVSIYSHGEIIVSGVESQRYFYIVYIPTCFPTVSFLDGRMDGRAGEILTATRLIPMRESASFLFHFSFLFLHNFSFFLEEDCFLYFFIYFILFFFFIFFIFFLGGGRRQRTLLFDRMCVCVSVCVSTKTGKKKNPIFMFLFWSCHDGNLDESSKFTSVIFVP
jgi:hypothetical protein